MGYSLEGNSVENEKQPSPEEIPGLESVYFDFLAELDFTRHVGGQDATRALVELCQINEDSSSRRRPAYRNLLKEALSEPKELIKHWGYGLYVGRKN